MHGNLKNIPKFTYLAITMTKSWNYHWYRFPGLSQLYGAIILQVITYATNQNSYLKPNQCNLKLLAHNLQNQIIKIFTIYTYLYPPYPKDQGMLWFYVKAARRPPPATRRRPPAARNGVNTITQKPRDGLFSNLVYTLVVIVSWPD